MTEPMGGVPAASFLDALGPRAGRRAEPRASIAIAGAGCALAVIGVLIVAGDTGTSDGDFNRVPGLILSALVVAAGLVTLQTVRQGPLATAGVVAAALGVPPFMFFLTWDSGGFPPYSTDGILIVSTLAWLVAFTVGPGRGRPFFLGAGLIGLWLTVLQLTEQVFEAPFGLVGMLGSGATARLESGGRYDGMSGMSGMSDGPGMRGPGFDGPGFHVPDPTTIGLLSLGLGLAYLVICRGLDARGRHGVATPFAAATLPALFVGTIFLSQDLEQAGTGLLALVIGLGLALHGARARRRATAWVGGAATALGAAVFLADMTDDATVGGMLFMAGGIGLVAAGHAISVAISEPDEMQATALESVPVAAGAEGATESAGGGDADDDLPSPSDPPPPPF